ncbi:hypothetical protein [Actinomadura sp. NPDC048394]|uniref:hypothetical protein n=1 Tax=Actinomadura sp. NPDC048394 TaxID=3158223 RepID=UPI00341080BA
MTSPKRDTNVRFLRRVIAEYTILAVGMAVAFYILGDTGQHDQASSLVLLGIVLVDVALVCRRLPRLVRIGQQAFRRR